MRGVKGVDHTAATDFKDDTQCTTSTSGFESPLSKEGLVKLEAFWDHFLD
jgi:hypothetical protein